MSKNGKEPHPVGEVVEAILGSLTKTDEHLLLDLEDQHPRLRVLLLGGSPGSGRAPAATLSFSRTAEGVGCRLAIPQLGVIADWDCGSFFGTLEVIELELGDNTVRWRSDWKRVKKERGEWDGVA